MALGMKTHQITNHVKADFLLCRAVKCDSAYFTIKDTFVVRKLKKETIDKDRLFFCCAQQDSCNYFECVPEESFYEFSRPLTKQNEKEQCSKLYQ